MACSEEYIGFVCEALAPLGEVRHRKMMGDYIIYVNGKCVVTACDNQAYIKKLDCIAAMMADCEVGRPYEGAKECYILDFSNQRKAREVVSVLWEALPMSGKKK